MIKPLISIFFKLIQLSSCGWAGPSWPSQVIGKTNMFDWAKQQAGVKFTRMLATGRS
jgi:hypothetical protein